MDSILRSGVAKWWIVAIEMAWSCGKGCERQGRGRGREMKTNKGASSPAGEVYAVSADDFVPSFARDREQPVRHVEPDGEHVILASRGF